MTDKPGHETIEWGNWTGPRENCGVTSADGLIGIWLRLSDNRRGGTQWNMSTTSRGRWAEQESVPPMAFPAMGSEAARAYATGIVQYALVDQHEEFPPERLAELQAKFADLAAEEDAK